MGRPRNPVPKYLHHKPSGQARIRVAGQDVYLGKYDSPSSRAEYHRICAEIEAAGAAVALARTGGRTVAEVADAYLDHARAYYRQPDGSPTTEYKNVAAAAAAVLELYAHARAADFGPLALKAVREKWVKSGVCRTGVNNRVHRVRRMFRWAAAEELIGAGVHQALLTVEALKKGRTPAPERAKVLPVPDKVIARTLPHLTPVLVAMLQLMRLTGMRPGEVRRMRPKFLDRSKPLWVYAPEYHKKAYMGKSRPILIGPRARKLLAPYLKNLGPDDLVFRREMQSRARGSGEIQVTWFGQAVAIAARKAGVPAWHPNQIRHTFATEVRRKYGIEQARILLGHEKLDTTEIYAEQDRILAARVAREVG